MSTARRETKIIRVIGVKLPNARIEGGLLADGSISFRFKRLQKDRTIRFDGIRLSRLALAAMTRIANRLAEDPAHEA